VRGKKPNSCAGSGQNPGDATGAHLAGGLVRRAPLPATRPADCGVATANALHRGDRRARGETLVNNQDHRPACCHSLPARRVPRTPMLYFP
jgi:hypothetical protein